MTRNTKYVKWLILFLLPLASWAQKPVLTLDTILQRIDNNNLMLQSYRFKADSYKHSADAATAWMAPMIGLGTFMMPYPNQMIMDARDKGSLMLQIEQDIPNLAKLSAKRKYIASQGNVERANRSITLNTYKAQAKRLYFNWLIARQRVTVLEENEKIMVMMKKIEEVRYPYNQSQLGGVYRAESKILENQNMIRMQEGTIGKAKGWLNSLMNATGNQAFEIDTAYKPSFQPAMHYDTATLADARMDVFKMNESIRSMQLNIESMKQQKKPDFKIRFDHMYPLDAMMPNAYSVMGMLSIPIAPWSSKMYKSDIKAMQLNIQGMLKERSAMLVETQGMLYGMQSEIGSMQTRVSTMQDKILPVLQKAMDSYFVNYQENKAQLPVVIDAWEALTMMQMNVLDEKLKLYEMIVDYEKELYR
ncbi:TolC family protein [Dyadobacter sp. LHD-138]|uniref:TolC family protein n=1 Tax=Dyadobacter sp. LHD-138 TaxID=3071413 RepID=UPI0027DF6334|nr:TolC family protein [Dyadobacter sp. LHD-138]MDQ6480576.1 TolC family protein [Dyadobacter sp. LHD-138]